MRIRDFRRESFDGGARATACVEWEDAGRPPQIVVFAAEGEIAGRLEPTAEAFVLAAAAAAARAGERRIRVEGSICPVFTDGLGSALALLDSWSAGSRGRLKIEAAGGFRARRQEGSAAFFFSGGVDSLYVLRRNRLDLPRDHRDSLRVGIHLRAFSFVEGPVDEASRNIFRRAVRSITPVARAENLSLLFVESNARRLDPDRSLFGLETQSAQLAAAAHLFPGVIRSAAIAASVDVTDLVPWGTHPLLDPLYSSSSVSIRHEGAGRRRVERVAEISRWEIALESLQVCGTTPIDPALLNCGECEKCVRTMCELRRRRSAGTDRGLSDPRRHRERDSEPSDRSLGRHHLLERSSAGPRRQGRPRCRDRRMDSQAPAVGRLVVGPRLEGTTPKDRPVAVPGASARVEASMERAAVKIHDFRLDTGDRALRGSAAVEWEDSPRPPRRLTFSTQGDLAGAFEPAPEAFVLSMASAASRAGERRLHVAARLCSVFANGLRSALALLDSWYGGSRAAMTIEAAGGFRARARGSPVAAMFLSGGVDSLHMLQRNRLVVPPSHPGFFRVAIHARSFGYAGDADDAEARNLWERASDGARRIAGAEGLAFAVVHSDARLFEPDRKFFIAESHAALLAASAHLFPGALRSASIASSADLRRHYRPWGSHPLLDPLYGSGAIAIRHAGHEFARLEKVSDLSRWDVAMGGLIVCNESPLPAGVTNCGQCEKCMRTLCELLAVGAVSRASTFAVRDVTPDSIRRLRTVEASAIRRWVDLRRELRDRADLCAAIDDWIGRLRTAAEWHAEGNWKGRLRRIDRAWLGGRLLARRRRRKMAT